MKLKKDQQAYRIVKRLNTASALRVFAICLLQGTAVLDAYHIAKTYNSEEK